MHEIQEGTPQGCEGLGRRSCQKTGQQSTQSTQSRSTPPTRLPPSPRLPPPPRPRVQSESDDYEQGDGSCGRVAPLMLGQMAPSPKINKAQVLVHNERVA